MKKTKVLLIVAVGILSGAAAQAQGYDLYSAHETSFDVFGFYGSRDKGGNKDAWGPGVGINYFFTQNIGVGADTYADAFEVPYLLDASGIYRYPIKDTAFAPYGFAGMGRQWDHAARWFGHLGVGIEYRLKPKTGVFADIREVFPTEKSDYAVFRFGFRFRFR